MKRFLLVALATVLVAPAPLLADVSDEDFDALRKQLAAVSQRLEELAAENAELRRVQEQTAIVVDEVKEVSPSGLKSWADRIKLDGDFRYRFESIDAEGSSTRDRSRIRARTNIKADVADNIQVGFGLATGSSDPVSTNQTLGDGGSSKGVVLNLAYVDWEATDGLHVLGGKFKNPLYRAGGQPLMWDGDWTPEGIALKFRNERFFVNLLGTYLESDTRNSNENFSLGGQVGTSARIGDVKLTGGLGYHSFKTAGDETTFGDPSDPGDYFGNTAVETGGLPCGTTPGADCVYLYDYELTQVFGEAAFDVGEWPMSVFFDYVRNGDAADNDTGWTVGAKIGQAKDRGQLQFSYLYADKEADAVFGLLADSDFGGGGTDSKGHWVQLNYGVSKSWTIGAQYFFNETDLASGSKSDYDRLMVDMQWKWK